MIVPERYSNETVPEVVAESGFALLHFISDAAYNLTGFNISYRYTRTHTHTHTNTELSFLAPAQF